MQAIREILRHRFSMARCCSTKNGALAGIRVLDLSRILAGPYCTQLLGDMGAEVIKIEQPGLGDGTRMWGPPFNNGESAYFLGLNRNKKSITIDLSTEQGLSIAKELVLKCDVLIENYLPGKLDELGLSFEECHKINPKLVYCSISGFGSSGPMSHKPGFDIIVSAMYGIMHITGLEDGKDPVKPGVAITDVCTGMLAHGAILAALLERQKSGLGQKIETSLMETQLSALVNVASNYLIGGVDLSKRWGTAHPNIVPYQAFMCADGRSMVIGIGTDIHFKNLAQAMEMPELLTCDLYSSNALRVKHRASLVPKIASRFLNKSRDDWNSVFETCNFPFGPVRSVQESLECAQAQARDMVMTVPHSKCGDIKLVGKPVKFSRSKQTNDLPPPTLGQHNREILSTLLDYDDEKIQNLIHKHVIE